MKILNNKIFAKVMIAMLGILVLSMPNWAHSQTGPLQVEESVEFNISGKTYLSNVTESGLMLNIIERLQGQKYLEHLNASSTQEIGSRADSTDNSKLNRFEMEAIYRFDTYEKFQTWYRSDEVAQLIDRLKAKLNTMNLNLNMTKRK